MEPFAYHPDGEYSPLRGQLRVSGTSIELAESQCSAMVFKFNGEYNFQHNGKINHCCGGAAAIKLHACFLSVQRGMNVST